MKIFAIVATMIGLAAGTSASAQNRVQEGSHTVTAQPCFETFEQADRFMNKQTEQTILFTGLGLIQMLDQTDNEYEDLALITIYVNQYSTYNFTILKTFEDGVTCLLTEGTEFTPYVK
mgnify:CR=1 FL=1